MMASSSQIASKSNDKQMKRSQNRRLSKQEEVDLEGEEGSVSCNEMKKEIGDEKCVKPAVTIEVIDSEDKCGNDNGITIMAKNNDDNIDASDDVLPDKDISCDKEVATNSGQSSPPSSSINSNNGLTDEVIADKKKGKTLCRSEACDESVHENTNKLGCNLTLESKLNDSSKTKSSAIDSLSQCDNEVPTTKSATSVKMQRKSKLKQTSASSSSQGSAESNSPSIVRDSNTENYTDFSGIDLEKFLIETLQANKNNDRIFLLKTEQELIQLVKDSSRQTYKFSPDSSYNRMLEHRVAAYFGLEHNVEVNEQGQTNVCVKKMKNTRIPDIRFNDHIQQQQIGLCEPKKSILKRDSSSFEDSNNQSGSGGESGAPDRSPDRNASSLNKARSLEEREENYEKTRARIFNQGSSSSSGENCDNQALVVPTNGQTTYLEVTAGVGSGKDGIKHQHSQEIEGARPKLNKENRPWRSADTESSLGRNNTNHGKANHKPTHYNKQRFGNSLDSTTNSCESSNCKSSTISPSCSSSGNAMLSTPGFVSPTTITSTTTNSSVNSQQSGQTRPSVTKAGSFGGISKVSRDNNGICSGSNGGTNSTNQSKLTKCGSMTGLLTNANTNHSPSPSITPKIDVARHDNALNAHHPHSNKQHNNKHAKASSVAPKHQSSAPLLSQQQQQAFIASQTNQQLQQHQQQKYLMNMQRRQNGSNNGWHQQVVPNYGQQSFMNSAENNGKHSKHLNHNQMASNQQQLLLGPIPSGYLGQPLLSSDHAIQVNNYSQQQPLLYYPYSVSTPLQPQISYPKSQSMQHLQDKSHQHQHRNATDVLVSQLGGVSLNASNPSMQQQTPYSMMRHANPPSVHSHSQSHSQSMVNNVNTSRYPIQQMNQSMYQQQQQQQQQQPQQVRHQKPHNQQHQPQQPIRLVYSNPSNNQFQPLIGTNMTNAPFQTQPGGHQAHQQQQPQMPYANHLPNQVPYQIHQQQAQQSVVGFPYHSNQANQSIHSNSNGIVNPNLSQLYGTQQMQVPQGMPMYVLGNNVQSLAMPNNHSTPIMPLNATQQQHAPHFPFPNSNASNVRHSSSFKRNNRSFSGPYRPACQM